MMYRYNMDFVKRARRKLIAKKEVPSAGLFTDRLKIWENEDSNAVCERCHVLLGCVASKACDAPIVLCMFLGLVANELMSPMCVLLPALSILAVGE